MAVICDLNAICDEIKTILDAANVVSYDPIDLSANLTQRVKKVLTTNPEYIPPQASFFPFVTSYVTFKSNTSEDIAKDQLNMKRTAMITIEIVGGVFNQNMVLATQDPAAKDIYNLMENIELVLRSNYNLNRKVNWQKMTEVRYYSSLVDAKNHIRAGVMQLTAKVLY